MKFLKKPVVINAVPVRHVLEDSRDSWPEWVREAVESRKIILKEGWALIPTLEGQMCANHDDWLIRGVKGEIHPCKPDIFEKTYEIFIPETT